MDAIPRLILGAPLDQIAAILEPASPISLGFIITGWGWACRLDR